MLTFDPCLGERLGDSGKLPSQLVLEVVKQDISGQTAEPLSFNMNEGRGSQQAYNVLSPNWSTWLAVSSHAVCDVGAAMLVTSKMGEAQA